MNALYRYYLDGVRVADPMGWEKLEDTMRRDDELKAILITQDISFDFVGEAYRLLRKKFDFDGVLSFTLLRIEESQSTFGGEYETIFEGTIFTSDIEFDRQECIAKAKIQDNSFYAKINGNKSLEAYIEVGKSKNDVEITPCPRYSVTLFNPCTGTFGTTPEGRSWRVFDAFKFIVAFMTDGEMEFDSPLFTEGSGYIEPDAGEFGGLMITRGYFLQGKIFEATEKSPLISFSKLFTALNKKLNLGFYIDHTGAKPKLIIDYYNKLFVEAVALTFDNVDKIISSVDVNRLYSQVKLGSTKFIEKGSDVCSVAAFFDEAVWIGVKEESYIVIGKGNIDKTLDLSDDDFIISNNIIQDVYVDQINDYDDELFFLDCAVYSSFNNQATANKGVLFSQTTPVYYNTRLYNDQVAARFFNGVPNTIALRLGAGSANNFMAVKTSQTSHQSSASSTFTFSPIRFADDYSLGNDIDNNYGNGTSQGTNVSAANSRYTATGNGFFHFTAKIILVYNGTQFSSAPTWIINIKRFGSGGTLKSTYTKSVLENMWVTNGNRTIINNSTVYMETTDYVIVEIGVEPGSFQPVSFGFSIQSGSFFALTATDLIGGEFQTYDVADYPVIKHKFKVPMPLSDYEQLKGNKKVIGKRMHQIKATSHGETVTGWIDNLKYNQLTSKAEFTLTSNNRK